MIVSRSSLRGFYAITPDSLCADSARLEAAVAAAVRGGAALIQYRDKRSAPDQRLALAARLVALCHAHGARLIINDDFELAEAVGADGAHLGASDGSLEAARQRLGPTAILGASCGPSLARAESALAAGASYIAFGRFFDSLTKPNAPLATVELLAEARQRFPGSSICAIGGVTPANGGMLVAQGADLIAAVEGVFGYDDLTAIEAAATAYRRLFVP